MSGPRQPAGFAAIGGFWFFGAFMAALAAITLLWPGSALDRVWLLNRRAYAELAPRGRIVGLLFLLLSGALAAAGVGWFGRRRWGWRLAIAIIATQALGDLVNFLRGDFLRGFVGVAIAGALLLYLLSPRIKGAFGDTGSAR